MSWLPGVPLGPSRLLAGLPWLVATAGPPTNEAWPAGRFGFPVTIILAPSAEPVMFGVGLVELDPLSEMPGTPVTLSLRHEVMPDIVQWSVTQPSGLNFSFCPRLGASDRKST